MQRPHIPHRLRAAVAGVSLRRALRPRNLMLGGTALLPAAPLVQQCAPGPQTDVATYGGETELNRIANDLMCGRKGCSAFVQGRGTLEVYTGPWNRELAQMAYEIMERDSRINADAAHAAAFKGYTPYNWGDKGFI